MGYLAPLEIQFSDEILSTEGIGTLPTGEVDLPQFERRHNKSLISVPVHEWQQHGQGKPTVIFATSQQAAAAIAQRIACDHHVNVGLLLSSDEILEQVAHDERIWTDRPQIVQTFSDETDETLRLIVCVNILNEGFDCPGAVVAIVARPTRSLAVHRQIIGRILRPAPGKIALVIECTDTIAHQQVGHPLDHYPWSLAPRQTEEKRGEEPFRRCDHCGAINRAAARACGACQAPFGGVCPRCRSFRWEEALIPRRGQQTAPHCQECHRDMFQGAPPQWTFCCGRGTGMASV